MVCTGNHVCHAADSGPILASITVRTLACSGCSSGSVEEGLQLQLTGLMGLSNCTTDNLDNPGEKDYSSGSTATFDRTSGIGGCEVRELSLKDTHCSILTKPLSDI